ncbi:MAG TPA: ankyrin repeat domain-containing protein [Luteitalea sp.]|nr:ankyrin repeat domain-containing protein [Luteitalea sp.]
MDLDAHVDAFLAAAVVPLDRAHTSGDLRAAEAIRASHPGIIVASLHAAAAYGDADAVATHLAAAGAHVSAVRRPHAWDALTYLCFSRYLRLDRSRASDFHRAACVLLEAGADAGTGFFAPGHQPRPEWESALYGAAGVAHDAELTRLLLAHGADANDDEVSYHAPETHDLAALRVLVEHGGLTPDSLATMLLRKHDWHDLEGVRLLLAHGADPNRQTRWGWTALQQALRRDNATAIIELLLAHGADPAFAAAPSLSTPGAATTNAWRLAAWRGRADVLDVFARRAADAPLNDEFVLMAAATRGDQAAARARLTASPGLQQRLLTHGAEWLALAAGCGNVAAVRCWVALGVAVDALWDEGDGYFVIAPSSTALHVAAWRGQHAVVEALLALGADASLRNGRDETPLRLAVRACVDAYWSGRRQPDSIARLLTAGADPADVPVPTGYDDADRLLALAARHRTAE